MNLDVFYMNFQKALLVFSRFSGIFVFAPLFGARTIPVRVKAWITVFLTLSVFPVVRNLIEYITSPWMFGFMVLDQVLIGLIIGFMFSLVLILFQLAGQIFSFNMGFGIVNTFDPLSETQISLIGQYLYILALMVFIITNGHHTIIYALTKSFELIPVIKAKKVATIAYYTMISITQMFRVALIIAAPILGTMLIVEIALGILTRVAPQMNVFVIGFAAKLVIGFFILLFFISFFLQSSAKFIDGFYKIILTMLKEL